MVAPRTRADEPAQSTPAARPAARKPRAARPKANGIGVANGTEHANGTAKTNGAAAKNGVATATTHRPTPKHDPRALGEQLIADVLKYDKDADVARLRKAIDFAIEAHGEQPRASGEPFVTHPITSAIILAELGLDQTAIEAAVLHDVPEDTEYS